MLTKGIVLFLEEKLDTSHAVFFEKKLQICLPRHEISIKNDYTFLFCKCIIENVMKSVIDVSSFGVMWHSG